MRLSIISPIENLPKLPQYATLCGTKVLTSPHLASYPDLAPQR